MNKQTETTSNNEVSDFRQQVDQSQPGFFREYVNFLRHSKKWWLIPILLALLVIGVLVVLGGKAAAPFIYTLF